MWEVCRWVVERLNFCNTDKLTLTTQKIIRNLHPGQPTKKNLLAIFFFNLSLSWKCIKVIRLFFFFRKKQSIILSTDRENCWNLQVKRQNVNTRTNNIGSSFKLNVGGSKFVPLQIQTKVWKLVLAAALLGMQHLGVIS